jgi:5-methylcytosine-specific restriction protein A
MPSRIKKPCSKIGCPNLTIERYCQDHQDLVKQEKQRYDKQRGNSARRGYDYQWSKKSKAFQSKPENQFCYIRGPKCNGLVEMTEHIVPPTGPNDPLFNDPNNHGPSCIACNSWKGKRSIRKLVQDERQYFDSIGHDPINELRSLGKTI